MFPEIYYFFELANLIHFLGNKESRQLGLASEAVRMMIAHIGLFLNKRVIQASVCSTNLPCIGLLEKLGFERQSQPASLDDIVFVLPNSTRLLIEQSVSIIYKNNSLIDNSISRSNEYFKGLE
jgi:hypothetical protein